MTRWISFLVSSVVAASAIIVGCATEQPTEAEATADDALSAQLGIRECRRGGFTTYLPADCGAAGPNFVNARVFFGSTEAVPGVTQRLFVCQRTSIFKHYVSADPGCEGGGTQVGPLGYALTRPLCGAVQFHRYLNHTTLDSRISATPIPGYQLEGPIGFFFDRAIATEQCCLSDARCGANTICRVPGQACQAGCRRDNQCATNHKCEASVCVAADCRTDAECSASQVCEARTCRPGCRADSACDEGHRCNLTTSLCE